MYWSIVGATSATPPSARVNLRPLSAGTIAMNGTFEVECDVIGLPSGVSIVSQLPWSARMNSPTPAFAQASRTLPTQ